MMNVEINSSSLLRFAKERIGRNRLSKDEDGLALVEFAMTAPIMLTSFWTLANLAPERVRQAEPAEVS